MSYFLTQPCRRYGWTTTMRPVAVARVHRLTYCVSLSLANCHSIAYTAVTNTLERPDPPISKFLISNMQLTGCSNYGDGAKWHDGGTIISRTFDLGILLRLPDVSGTSTRQDVLSERKQCELGTVCSVLWLILKSHGTRKRPWPETSYFCQAEFPARKNPFHVIVQS